MQPIIPIIRKEAFDDPAYLFELKLDGFRGIADTIQGRMLSKNGNRLTRFEPLLDALPPGSTFSHRPECRERISHVYANTLPRRHMPFVSPASLCDPQKSSKPWPRPKRMQHEPVRLKPPNIASTTSG